MALTDLEAIVMDAALATFGETVTYAGSPLTGVWRDEDVLAGGDGEVPVRIRATTLTLRSDAAAPGSGDVVSRAGVPYRVVDVVSDGLGATVLQLERTD